MVSGVGAANASEAKDNCEEDLPTSLHKDVCDDYQHVADSGGATAVSTPSTSFTYSCFII